MPAAAPRRSPGWKPKQHGAWFMLALPVVVGLIVRPADAGDASHLLPLIGCWVIGYLAFNAATLWLKAPAGRRSRHSRPVVVYGLIAGALGVLTLLSSDRGVLWWLVLFAPLVGVALWLASLRRERTLISGALTVAAASLVTLVVSFDTPAALFAAWGTPLAGQALGMVAVLFGYEFGTVFSVKTMIRERGHTGWLAASIGWHLGCTLGAVGMAWSGAIGWIWVAFFAATAVRAWLLPVLGRTRTIRPLVVGLVEIGFTTAFVVAALLN
ncbi:MAG TPA: YwiC-like family protein [Propionicimonas sp.]|nr:YwiC-like family protein [Propionicimonas sp.]